jgi:hypothetical protein
LVLSCAPGCVLANDYSIFSATDSGARDGAIFDGGTDAEIPCTTADECGAGSVCVGGVCRGCDDDMDGFAREQEGCPDDGPFDCDDSDAQIYPGALPICRDGVSQSCGGVFEGFPITEAGMGPPLDLGARAVSELPSISVLFAPPSSIAPRGGRAVAIVHEATPRAIAFDADGTVLSDVDLSNVLAPLGVLPSMDGSALRRIGGTVYFATTGDWGTRSGRAFYDLSAPALLSTRADGVTNNFRPHDAIVLRMGLPAMAYPQRMPGNINVYVSDANLAEGYDPRLDTVDAEWLAGDGALVMGNLDGGVYLFGANDATIVAPGPILTIPGADTDERGAIVELAGSRYVGVLPRSSGMMTFSMTAAEGRAAAALASMTSSDVDSPSRRLFAGARANDTTAVVVFAEASTVRMGVLTDGGLWGEPAPDPIFSPDDFGGASVVVDDVAITTQITGAQLSVLVLAVLRIAGTPHLVARQIVACGDDSVCTGNTCAALGLECGFADDGCGRPIECRCDAAETECTFSGCNTGFCEVQPRPNGTPCDDGNPDTAESSCQSGACSAAAPLDVHLVIDTTGSNYPDFTTTRTTLTDGLAAPLIAMGANVGIMYMGEFPIAPHGSMGDRPYEGGLEPGADVAAIRSELMTAPIFNGDDLGDALLEVFDVLSGGTPHPSGTPLSCSSGRVAGGCWRPGARRVIVVFTDSPIHGGPTTGGAIIDPYSAMVMDPATWTEVRARLINDGTTILWLAEAMSMAPAFAQFDQILTELGEPASYRVDWSVATINLAVDTMLAHIAAL